MSFCREKKRSQLFHKCFFKKTFSTWSIISMTTVFTLQLTFFIFLPFTRSFLEVLVFYYLKQWSSRDELSHPRVNETYFRVNEIFGVNKGSVKFPRGERNNFYYEKKLKLSKFIFFCAQQKFCSPLRNFTHLSFTPKISFTLK